MMENPKDIGVILFAHKLTGQRKLHMINFAQILPNGGQICYVCLSVRLSSKFILATTDLKISNNISVVVI